MTKVIKYLTISDIHLGHKRTKTSFIVRNLDTYFDNYKATSQFTDMDIIFIAGDLFDALLDTSGEDIHEVILWLERLMRFCSRFNIKLRILEGTPSHDWKQSKLSETVYNVVNQPVDFKYIDTLHIEHIEDLDLKILYIPDEWTSSVDLTYSQVEQTMRDLNITEVDIGIMHGMFGYQLKNVPASIQKHDEGKYLSIVKYYINIGHVHNYSHYERIIAQGSFDRLGHGEEEAKGGVVCTLDPVNGNSFSFIQNKEAKIYKTITLRYKDTDNSVNQIAKAVKNIPNDSYVRIIANKDHPLYIAFDDVKLMYPMYNFSKKSKEDIEDDYELIANVTTLDSEYTPITISKDNVVQLLEDEIKSKYNLAPEQWSLLHLMLGEIDV